LGEHLAPLLWSHGDAVGDGMAQQMMQRVFIGAVYGVRGEIAVAGVAHQQSLAFQAMGNAFGDGVSSSLVGALTQRNRARDLTKNKLRPVLRLFL